MQSNFLPLIEQLSTNDMNTNLFKQAGLNLSNANIKFRANENEANGKIITS